MASPDLVARLRAAGCVFAEDEAAVLAEAAVGDQLDDLVARRVAGEPLEYVVGRVGFCGDWFALEPGVFIPRQRTAPLVETAVDLAPQQPVVADLCCGCGAIGLSVAGRLPDADLYAGDLDPLAVELATRNGVPHARVGDLYDALPPELVGRIDLLLCNAPYVPTDALAAMPRDSRDHEPRATVDGGPDGMDVQRRLLAEARSWLAPGGAVLTETSHAQALVLGAIARNDRLVPEVVTDDERGATVLVARALGRT
jgi:release factor glutamine methyltransferase